MPERIRTIMPKLIYADDNKEFEFSEAQSILDISIENNVDHLHVCGGQGRCSTCQNSSSGRGRIVLIGRQLNKA
jgi:ferredoxin